MVSTKQKSSRKANSSIKAAIQYSFRALGFSIRRYRSDSEIQPIPVHAHFLEALYETEYYEPTVFECDVRHCVNVLGHNFGPDGWHPYVALIRDYLEGKSSSYQSSILEQYYGVFQPLSARDVPLTAHFIPRCFMNYPPYAFLAPWEPKDIEVQVQFKGANTERENRAAGYPDVSIEDGFSHYGPVSKRKGQVEYERLTKVIDSIRERGYQRTGGDDGDISGTVLQHKGTYRLLVNVGHHRLAAVAALGYKSIPVRLRRPLIIESEHVDRWPQVRRGLWKRENAIEYFAFLFHSNSREWAQGAGLLNQQQQVATEGAIVR